MGKKTQKLKGEQTKLVKQEVNRILNLAQTNKEISEILKVKVSDKKALEKYQKEINTLKDIHKILDKDYGVWEAIVQEMRTKQDEFILFVPLLKILEVRSTTNKETGENFSAIKGKFFKDIESKAGFTTVLSVGEFVKRQPMVVFNNTTGEFLTTQSKVVEKAVEVEKVKIVKQGSGKISTKAIQKAKNNVLHKLKGDRWYGKAEEIISDFVAEVDKHT